MDLFSKELVVTKITAAVFVPFSGGTPVHKNRPTHGFAFSQSCKLIYRFSNGKSISCEPGCCVYLPKGSSYVVEKIGYDTTQIKPGTYAINFLLNNIDFGEEPLLIPIHNKERVVSVLAKAVNAWHQKVLGYYEECFYSLYYLIHSVKTDYANQCQSSDALQKLTPAIAYIDANFTSEIIQIEKLAQLCGISQPYLRRLFQTAFAVSPAIYVRNKRINYAKDLLQSGEYSVTDAALLSGFNDAAYFSREFRKETGMSPNQYFKTIVHSS